MYYLCGIVMKNQYFGDIRDLFKYDLIYQIIKKIDSINHFIFIPMLTENDGGRDGNKKDYNIAKAGTNNKELMNFLSICIKEKKKNILELLNYFKLNEIYIYIYDENGYFNNKNRSNYFRKIGQKLHPNSLIFIDPDNGLEVKNSTEKHILYCEVKDIYDKMENKSILMLYQHIPYENHDKYLKKRSIELGRVIGKIPLYISDDEIIFFFLTKNTNTNILLANIIVSDKESYNSLQIGNINQSSKSDKSYSCIFSQDKQRCIFDFE